MMTIEIPPKSFVVLSQQRSGTHYLRGLLDSHPDIKCHSEVFSHGGVEDLFPECAHLQSVRRIIPHVLSKEKDKVNGFIVQDSQRAGTVPRDWNHELLLKCNPQPLIIWLQRENTLSQYASWLVALETKCWMRGANKPPKKQISSGSLSPEPGEAARWIHEMQQSRKELREKLKSLPSIDVTYERLVTSPERICSRIFELLDARPHRVAASTHPQRSYRIQDVFANYEAIIEAVSLEATKRAAESKYEFTTDWFSGRIPNWEKHLKDYGSRETHALEVGSWEGRSAVWNLENLLRHQNSTLTCIDPFEKPGVEARFDQNIVLSGYGSKLKKLKGKSWEKMKDLTPNSYDLVYLDGCHHGSSVLADAVLAFRLLKVGGMLIFDDYHWKGNRNFSSFPKAAIDAFLHCYSSELEVVEKGWQVFVRKTDPSSLTREPMFQRGQLGEYHA